MWTNIDLVLLALLLEVCPPFTPGPARGWFLNCSEIWSIFQRFCQFLRNFVNQIIFEETLSTFGKRCPQERPCDTSIDRVLLALLLEVCPPTLAPLPPWRQPRGKLMVSLVNSHANATRIGWHLWAIDRRFAPGLPPGWWSLAGISKVNFSEFCQFFGIDAHKMAPKTIQWR